MSSGDGDGDGDGDGKPLNRDDLVKTVESLQKAQKAQSTANDLKSKAMAMTDSTKREKMLREAFDKEVEAHGHTKMAKRMQSGTWQGLGFGGGIGAATGLGLGAGLGTVLGAIAAVPTTGIGMLVGSGVGAIHGPWIKLGGKEEKFEEADPEKIADALEEARVAQGNAQGEGIPEEGGQSAAQNSKPRRKPKKLEIRSQPKGQTESSANPQPDQQGASSEALGGVNKGVAEESKPRRKPKKLEIRSGQGQRQTRSGNE
ncbi:hypothetical protein A1O3_07183 [Capronia epimyces CBS 606.96]|uniref:Uncharacterized protein n=1 Tax=Capronia epimyces CBS 606.96 TaxID=1182542 RepID=W9XUA2_9EURO|nr:uncharacterized protein A1O3_07183 [Capronia epimyces CBS 606.96]EXJ80895.1 hypothetical protein A1O3_07183 [Capronia epimyces CBS 606.96]